MAEPAPYSGKLWEIIAAGRNVCFQHIDGPCTNPARHFRSLADCEPFPKDIRLSDLMKRPCKACGSKRWIVDVWEPDNLGGFSGRGHSIGARDE